MAEFQHISVSDAQKLWQQQSAVFVDIRDIQSFGVGHVPGSQRLTDASFVEFSQQTDEETPIVVVCYHGVSSQGAAQYLAQQGYETVYSMDGGFTAWMNQFPEHVESQP
ncbi:thiosulfate sulfurtransferase GlpE [Idiomarina tyrosinivorans]|uniref:Thiosulfate sulfurtransferase GlpE n=1 Tax=Idiomarina tyrosinivorans TaxID=1445662 RepID=A0A432ZTA6_9GAMM|nr:thiosulfate sulfurtransferase GlpE [Idiomarina tyrosinivorans]RUO81164.1 thiosulfate sulfurtransferase GlpE [Idiomarina tyrosinivorans]